MNRRTFLSALIASPVISQVPAAKPIEPMSAVQAELLSAMKVIYDPLPADIARNIMLKSRQHGMTGIRRQMIYADLNGIREVKA